MESSQSPAISVREAEKKHEEQQEKKKFSKCKRKRLRNVWGEVKKKN
jgi:hypothetical protein